MADPDPPADETVDDRPVIDVRTADELRIDAEVYAFAGAASAATGLTLATLYVGEQLRRLADAAERPAQQPPLSSRHKSPWLDPSGRAEGDAPPFSSSRPGAEAARLVEDIAAALEQGEVPVRSLVAPLVDAIQSLSTGLDFVYDGAVDHRGQAADTAHPPF